MVAPGQAPSIEGNGTWTGSSRAGSSRRTRGARVARRGGGWWNAAMRCGSGRGRSRFRARAGRMGSRRSSGATRRRTGSGSRATPTSTRRRSGPRCGGSTTAAASRSSTSCAGAVASWRCCRSTRTRGLLRLIGSPHADRHAPPCEDVATAGWALREIARRRRRLVLADRLPGEAGWERALGGRCVARVASPRMRLTTTHAAWLAAQSAATRRDLRRRERRLVERGTILRRLEAEEAVTTGIDTLLRLHEQRWGAASNAEPGSRAPRRASPRARAGCGCGSPRWKACPSPRASPCATTAAST